jgi:hypothetical protein
MLVLCLLLILTGVSVAKTFEEFENFRYHWKMLGYEHHHNIRHYDTHQVRQVSLEGGLASSLSSGLFEFNATGRHAGSQITINLEADILGGSITAWTTVDITRRSLRHLPIPPHLARFFSGAQMKECIALKINVDRTMMARKLEQIQHLLQRFYGSYVRRARSLPKCYLDGVESVSWFGGHLITSSDFTLRAFPLNRHVLLNFSDYHEWTGPLDPRPKCGRTVENARLVAPALQFLVLSLPDGDFKTGVQDLIVDMSDIEQQDQGVLNVPTSVGVFVAFGVSIISIIAGFAIGQRSRARNMDSDYETVNA